MWDRPCAVNHIVIGRSGDGLFRPEERREMKKIIKWYLIGILMTILGSTIIAKTVKAEEAVTVPEEIRQISEELGQEYNICPELIQAICFKESRFRQDAVNGDCIGIMQISERWHKDRMDRLGVTDLKDAEQNMTVAADYLSDLAERYEGDIGVALMVYNGDSSVKEVLAGTGKISDYAEYILMLSAQLEEQHGK